jgi:hypothetical protein
MTESTVKPTAIKVRKIVDGIAYIYHRSNITSQERVDEDTGESTTMYVYDEAQYQVPVGNVTKAELLERIVNDADYRALLASRAEAVDADLGSSAAQQTSWTKESQAPANTYWAQVAGFDAQAEKPLQVTRNWSGHDITLWVYVSQDVADAYVAGNLEVGDYVLVVFVDDDPELPIATQKVYQSW